MRVDVVDGCLRMSGGCLRMSRGGVDGGEGRQHVGDISRERGMWVEDAWR